MANRLADQTSPYLLQHKDNPVDWHPWGEEALVRSRAEDKPILLSIGYSACHWCHVMERESFEDEATAAYMNEHFVPIKVDREERPDIDAIYMEAVQSMTGHGGWPLTAFLDPDCVPFYAGTYYPPAPRRGMPSFKQVMEAVVASFTTRRDEIQASAVHVREQLGAVGRLQASTDELKEAVLHDAVTALRAQADMANGGFGRAPKFPPCSALELLLARGETEVVELTLDAMAAGGIHDQIGGGFARYSVDAVWLVPHFEKMLYDNALLARVYLHGWQVLGRAHYREVCERTLDWALREMRGAEGGFYSALDADSEGEEGRFYVWTQGEIRAVLSEAGFEPGEVEAILSHYGSTADGNFEGSNILNLPAGAGAPAPARLDDAREALYQARSRRVWPGLDDKRLLSWNALLIGALAEAGAVLGRDDFLAAAEDCADFLWDGMRDDDGHLLRTYKDGRAHLNAYLEDHAYLLEAMLTLYESSFEIRFFEYARVVADAMIERFGDPERGGFFTTSDDHEQLIARRKDVDDHPIPSGNAAAAYGLLRLAALTGDARYEEHAVEVLRLLTGVSAKHPQALSHLLQALNFHLSEVKEVALVAPASHDELDELATVVRTRFRPTVVLAGGTAGTETPELMRARPAVDGLAAAYVCERFSCRAPVTSAAELAAALG